ncbi:hypothetical protein VE01_05167 [Pseudogymnoascus verrucosus]|uniref:Uncharacterized protein n=1 Tax=Pseudogymnoascus verrucosus TaxID=342668 RepID=A0A1B8GI67_9PEZI|nr:uncharacterized protein VE01_05167 [Pseudogymnoascus verrucosus]OBT95542.1 hypothetical protein VE01_05167 [Pseudogymnoascus verrucosus]
MTTPSPASYQGRPSVRERVRTVLDRVISPDVRRAVYTNVRGFAHDQPLLASFILAHLLLSLPPLLLFASFVLGVSLLAALAALAFTLFWTGLALLVLLPVLCVTGALGVGVWVWAVATYGVARWAWRVLPVSGGGRVEVGVPGGRRGVVRKGEGDGVEVEVKNGEKGE